MKVIITVLLSLLFVSCEDSQPKYTRSECITKTILYWDKNLTKKEQLKINNDFYSAKLLMWLNRDKLKLLIPGVSFPMFSQIDNKGFPKVMYSLYENECENKEKMLFIFLEYIKFYVPDFPKYKITQEVVEPGIHTIGTRGKKYWIDG